MTVHKSKGLEYPVVFLAESDAKLIPRNDTKAKAIFEKSLGVGIRARRDGGLAFINNGIINAINEKNKRLSVEEEMRVYYVAATRARERLYVVGTVNEEFDKYTESLRKLGKPDSYTLYHRFPSILSIVLTLAESDSSDIEIIKKEAEEGIKTYTPLSETAEKTISEEKIIDSETLLSRFRFEYPDTELSRLPEKIAVSTLSPAVLDGVEEEVSLSIDGIDKVEFKARGILPEFITGKARDESAKRGIATHTFMQFCDMRNLYKNGVERELSRLVEKGFLSKKDAARVRLSEIELFKNSALIKEILEAKKCYREQRFNVTLPASLFTQDEKRKLLLEGESILVQGVIDCIIEDNSGDLHLIDYKTDRLTKEELSDKALAEKALADKHKTQLYYYALAIKELFGKSPKSVEIYSLPLGDTVNVLPPEK